MIKMIFKIKKRNKKRKIWFENNQDAYGYNYNDNRAINGVEDRRETVRRIYNI